MPQITTRILVWHTVKLWIQYKLIKYFRGAFKINSYLQSFKLASNKKVMALLALLAG